MAQAKSNRRVTTTTPSKNTEIQKIKYSKEDEPTFYKCPTYRTPYKKLDDNFPASQSEMYAGWNYHLPICKRCMDKLFEHYTEVYGNDEDAAIRRICEKFDIYYNVSLLNASRKITKNCSRIHTYVSRANLNQYKGKTFATKKYFICGLPYQIAIKENLLSREQVEDEMSEADFDETKFSMEMGCFWYGDTGDAFFSFNDVSKRRKLKTAMYPPSSKYKVSEFYTWVVDPINTCLCYIRTSLLELFSEYLDIELNFMAYHKTVIHPEKSSYKNRSVRYGQPYFLRLLYAVSSKFP